MDTKGTKTLIHRQAKKHTHRQTHTQIYIHRNKYTKHTQIYSQTHINTSLEDSHIDRNTHSIN